MPTTCESWELPSLGAVGMLARVASNVRPPGPDDVVVEVRAIGLNYADIFCALGLYEAANAELAASGEGDGPDYIAPYHFLPCTVTVS